MSSCRCGAVLNLKQRGQTSRFLCDPDQPRQIMYKPISSLASLGRMVNAGALFEVSERHTNRLEYSTQKEGGNLLDLLKRGYSNLFPGSARSAGFHE